MVVGCAPCGFRGERGIGKHFDEPPVEIARTFGGVGRSARVRGQRFLVGCLAHQNLVAVGRGLNDDAFGLNPAGDGRRRVTGVEDRGIVAAGFFDISVGIDAKPRAALFGDNHFAANLHAIDFLRTCFGSDVEYRDAQRGRARASHGLDLLLRLFLRHRGQSCTKRNGRKRQKMDRPALCVLN